MTKISVVATLTAAEGKEQELSDALVALVAAGDEEPGLEVYSVHTDPKRPGVFVFFELYADDEAMKVHGKGEQMAAAMGALGGLLAGRPEITRMAPLAAKGLDI